MKCWFSIQSFALVAAIAIGTSSSFVVNQNAARPQERAMSSLKMMEMEEIECDVAIVGGGKN